MCYSGKCPYEQTGPLEDAGECAWPGWLKKDPGDPPCPDFEPESSDPDQDPAQ